MAKKLSLDKALEAAGIYFGLDATGMAWVMVVDDESGSSRGTRISGPWTPAQVALAQGMKALAKAWRSNQALRAALARFQAAAGGDGEAVDAALQELLKAAGEAS